MFGSFIKTRRRLDSDSILQPGIPIVAVCNPGAFEQTGVVNGIRFGIIAERGMVIYRHCYHDNSASFSRESTFEVLCLPLSHFCPTEAWGLYTYNEEETYGSAEEVLQRAEDAVGGSGRADISIPGDDFVYEILSGKSMLQFMEEHPEVGTHCWTPLNYTFVEVFELMNLSFSLSKAAAEILSNDMLKLEHHGMRIESDQMVHFSVHRTRDHGNRIKTDSYADFCMTTNCPEVGGTVEYADESAAFRLRARNTAIGIMTHKKEWGEYNLASNNCEHFCRYCCTGEKDSQQVRDTIAKVSTFMAVNVAAFLIPGGAPVRIIRLLIQMVAPLLTAYMLHDTRQDNKILPL